MQRNEDAVAFLGPIANSGRIRRFCGFGGARTHASIGGVGVVERTGGKRQNNLLLCSVAAVVSFLTLFPIQFTRATHLAWPPWGEPRKLRRPPARTTGRRALDTFAAFYPALPSALLSVCEQQKRATAVRIDLVCGLYNQVQQQVSTCQDTHTLVSFILCPLHKARADCGCSSCRCARENKKPSIDCRPSFSVFPKQFSGASKGAIRKVQEQ